MNKPTYDLRQYLATQKQESYRAFIIHAPAMGHKTSLAGRMRDALGAHVLDLQAFFLDHPDLAAHIDRFDPQDLEKLVLDLNVPEQIVVVDNMDFLLNTWSKSQLDQFVGMVNLRLRSPTVTNKTFVFMLQSNLDITGHRLKNTHGQPRILPLEAFYAL